MAYTRRSGPRGGYGPDPEKSAAGDNGADASTLPHRADLERDRELRELDRLVREPGLLTAPEVAGDD